jgi:hypothetical protein
MMMNQQQKLPQREYEESLPRSFELLSQVKILKC